MFRNIMVLAGVVWGISLSTAYADHFLPGTNYRVSSSPTAILSGDYDNDGNMDIATGFNVISVLLGTGSGRFQPYIPSANGNSISAQGDFDQDGYLDIARPGISISLNLGNGTFAAPYYLPNTGGFHLSSADFNNDLIMDLVSLGGVILGLGDGNFEPQTQIQGLLAGCLLPLDLNRDGNMDLISSDGGQLRVHLGNGDGTFQSWISYNTGAQMPGDGSFLACGDLTNDGWMDVLVSNYQSNTVSILLGTGNGNLGTATNIPVTDGPGNLITDDFNEDGNNDFAMVHSNEYQEGTMKVYFGDGAGGISGIETYGIGRSPTGITTADFNNDEHLDLALSIQGDALPEDSVTVFLNSLPPSLPPIQISLNPINPPIQIPLQGGSFDFNATVANSSNQTVLCDVWFTITIPGGYTFEAAGPYTFSLPDSTSITRLRTQFVPGNAPVGYYSFSAMVGDYPWSVWDSDFFLFEKLLSGVGSWITDWSNTGSSFATETNIIHNSSLITHNLSPNPFNPSTILSYELRAASFVNLSVYDVSGRLVSTLVNGWREAGKHEVTFDGSALPSGVYLYRLEAGEFRAAGKMVLLK